MNQYKIALCGALLAASLLAGANASQAQMIVTFDNYADTFTKSEDTGNINIIGWQFTTTTDLYVSKLGFFDLNATDAHQVALYDATGTPVASATSTTGTWTTNGFFRMGDIAGVTLKSGQIYTLAATVGTDAYTSEGFGTNTFSGLSFNGVSYVTDVFDSMNYDLPLHWNSLDSAGVYGAFGPNMDANPVPEPATMLLFGVGIAGLAGLRRRKK